MGFDSKVCLLANSQFHISSMKNCKQIVKRTLSLFNLVQRESEYVQNKIKMGLILSTFFLASNKVLEPQEVKLELAWFFVIHFHFRTM